MAAAAAAVLLAGALTAVARDDGDRPADRVAAPAAPPPASTTAPPAPPPPPPASGPLLSYVVNTAPGAEGVRLGAQAVEAQGGEVVVSWPQVGVVVAHSAVVGFAARVRGEEGVQSAGATRTAAVVPKADSAPEATPTEPGLPAEGTAPDLVAIGADRLPPGAGSRDVLVAVLDSGVEDTHPDLAPAFDAEASAGCTDAGRLDRDRAAWLPTSSDHGTHVAGTIAAADDGQGVVGVAPGVRLSSVKVVDEAGLIYPEYAVCGYLWAAESGADVSNASLYVDPWQYWCPGDPDQAAAVEAVQRAVRFATAAGVLSVAAAGNDSTDLAAKTSDSTSPNDTVPVTRPITSACVDLPAELDGVVTVAATQDDGTKARFSNWGLGVVDVAAPGVDVWSTTLGGSWGTKSGTSMAAPHVAGVAALLASRLPDAPPAELARLLEQQATDTPCRPLAGQPCAGTDADNAYAGEGVVDALAAATG